MTEPLIVVEAKLRESSTTVRHLICREIRDGSSPAGRSIMVMNIPPLVTAEAVKQAFQSIAAVQNVSFEEANKNPLPTTRDIDYRGAKVIFKEKETLKLLSKQDYKSPLILVKTETHLENPMKIWMDNYNKSIITLEENKTRIDTIVQVYDKESEVKKSIRKEVNNEPDEEGWITVKRMKPDSLNKDKAMIAREKVKQEKKKRKEANVAEIYQYRLQETKVSQLRQLRKKYEQDKFKIAQIKSGRKFKPL